MKLSRFSIRDILWLTVVVGIAISWGLTEYRWRQRYEEQRGALNKALGDLDFQKYGRRGGGAISPKTP